MCYLSQQISVRPHTDRRSIYHFNYYGLAILSHLCAVLTLSSDPLIVKLSNFRKRSYRFIEDLLALESASRPLHSVPHEGSVSTPSNLRHVY